MIAVARIPVEEIAKREDPAHNYFLDRANRYTSDSGPGLPWHKENTKAVATSHLLKKIDCKMLMAVGFQALAQREHDVAYYLACRNRSSQSGRGDLFKGLMVVESYPRCQRRFSRTGDRLFAPVSLTQNKFHDMMLDSNQSAVPTASEERK